MDINIVTDKIIGSWITQSTKYKLLSNNKLETSTCINQMKWSNLSNNNLYLNLVKKNIKVKYLGSNLLIYQVSCLDYKYHNLMYYIVFLENKFKKIHVLKFSKNFTVINQFIVKEYNANYLYLLSESKLTKITIAQKIYFLNTNVKLVKSTVKNQNRYLATGFSSEIRIS